MKKKFKLILFGVTLWLVACNGDETKTTDTATDSTANAAAADSTSKNQDMDATTVAPSLYTVLKDSAGIRVLEVNYKPGDSSATHSHPDNVLYVIQGSKMEFTMADGSKQQHDLSSGLTMIQPAGSHAVKNIGTTPAKAILIEVKRSANGAGATDAAMDPMKVAPEMHKLVKDTMGIRAMMFTAKPGSSTGKHSHPDHVVYVIQGGKVEFSSADGTKQEREMKTGMAVINPGTTHIFKNLSNTTIKALVVEVNRPAQ